MGMSTHVTGFKPPDDTWARMKAVWDACAAVNIPPPREVDNYFQGVPPDPEGVEVTQDDLINYGALRPWEDDHSQGYELLVDRIPQDTTVIRFRNSW
jgi:hypothetical protein